MSPTASVQTLPLKRAWYPPFVHSARTPRAQRWMLRALNTSPHAWNTFRLSVHRMFRKKGSSVVSWCRSHSQNCTCRGRSSENSLAPRVVLQMQLLMKYIVGPKFGKSQFSSGIAWDSSRLSF
jgi:hypothetical protein